MKKGGMSLLLMIKEIQDADPTTQLFDPRQSFALQKSGDRMPIRRSQFRRKVTCTSDHPCFVRDGCHYLLCLKREVWQEHLQLVGEYAHGPLSRLRHLSAWA